MRMQKNILPANRKETGMFNILIVEDDYELRYLFQRVLIQNGYRVR